MLFNYAATVSVLLAARRGNLGPSIIWLPPEMFKSYLRSVNTLNFLGVEVRRSDSLEHDQVQVDNHVEPCDPQLNGKFQIGSEADFGWHRFKRIIEEKEKGAVLR